MKFSGTYHYMDQQGILQEFHVEVGDDDSVNLYMTQETVQALSVELQVVAGWTSPGGLLKMHLGPPDPIPVGHGNKPGLVLPWLAPKGFPPDPVVKAPPKVLQAKARSFIPVGTLVVLEPGSQQYVQEARPDETPCGVVTKCSPGMLDWYVDFTDDRPVQGPLKKS